MLSGGLLYAVSAADSIKQLAHIDAHSVVVLVDETRLQSTHLLGFLVLGLADDEPFDELRRELDVVAASSPLELVLHLLVVVVVVSARRRCLRRLQIVRLQRVLLVSSRAAAAVDAQPGTTQFGDRLRQRGRGEGVDDGLFATSCTSRYV